MKLILPNMDRLNNFPAVENALVEPNGLLAFGGSLDENTLLSAYCQGIFPWFSEEEPVLWWSPNPRMVLFPQKLHISRSFKRALRKTNYQVYFDRDFNTVINHCATTRKDGLGTWISAEMKQAYSNLFKIGVAHCLEIEIEGKLAGGIYGIALDNMFCGESMFSIQTNGSKFALYELCQFLIANDYSILDCQAENKHLVSMGAELISLKEFKQYLPKLA
ncbi:Leucyl/phenylalanyl-tRNA--protein transferase [hydrothermal vent metagenome]|uniref:Leucyl/phenylalanyl-tRNA--protein transferase n=1 Tax=hydrothermal vent metagenome TaxID=652676 RepID=A0A3B0VBS2_9ZZZZ